MADGGGKPLTNTDDLMRHIAIAIAIFLALTACSGGKDTKDTSDGMTASVAPADNVAQVTTMELQPMVFNHEIVSNGHLAARERVDVNFQTSGVIAAVYVKNGQHVAKGEKIARLDAYKLHDQLEKDRNAAASARLEMQDVIIGQGYDPEHPERVPEEVMRLARLKSGLEQAEISMKATQHELDDATLKAPISGIIANLTTKAHNLTGSEPLCRIINDSEMDVEFTVLESELPMVKKGDAVMVEPFSSGEERRGVVTEINPMVDENGMVKIWAAVNGGAGLIDGMNVRVRVKRALEETLVVPKSAVVLRSGRQVVFSLKDGKAMWNYVTTGLENLNEYTITEGLEPGMTLITSGNLNLAHESPVKVIKN